MSSHLRPGAFLKDTTTLVRADDAQKRIVYSCPLCKTLAVFCKGKIVPPYFRHPPESKCTFFTAGGLMSPQHLGAQQIAKNLLESQLPITFTRNCDKCRKDTIVFEISTRASNTRARTEEGFKINGKRYSADVALLENDEIKLIWEVYWTHATTRPAHDYPWVETCAQDILEAGSDGPLTFKCLRQHRCDSCVEEIAQKKREAEETAARLKMEREAVEVRRLAIIKESQEKYAAKKAAEEAIAEAARKTAREAFEAARKAALDAEKQAWIPFEQECIRDMYIHIHTANIFEIQKILAAFPGCLDERLFNGRTPMEEADHIGNSDIIDLLRKESLRQLCYMRRTKAQSAHPLSAPAPPPTAPASPVQSQ